MVADHFSRKWNTQVRISGIGYDPFRGISLEQIFVRDHAGDTLFAADRLSVLPDFSQLLDRNIHLRKVVVDHGNVQIITHKGDSTLNLQFIIDSFASTDTTTLPSDSTVSKWYFSGAAIELVDTRFHYQDENEVPAPAGMDYANIDVSHINLKISSLSFEGDTINATISELNAIERCGIQLLGFSGEFRVSPAFLKARNLNIVTQWSDVQLDFSFLYEHWSAYLDFINEVTIEGNIRPSILDLRDIGFFAPEMEQMNDKVKLEGKIKGTVHNFKADDFRFAFGTNTMFSGSVSSLGLPDIYTTYVDLNIRDFTTSVADIESFRIPGDSGRIILPEMAGKLGTIHIKGRFTGYYDDFVTQVKFQSDLGNVDANLTLKHLKEQKTYSYSGTIVSATIQLGSLLDSETFGVISLQGGIEGSGFSMDDARVDAHITIDSVDINHYRYRNISVKGMISEKSFNGMLTVNDRHLKMDFNGKADFRDSIPSFDFRSTIARADLFTLNLLQRDSIEILSGSIDARFKGDKLDNLDGRITLANVKYLEGEKGATMDNLELIVDQRGEMDKSYQLRSDIVDADVTGHFKFSSMIGALDLFVKNYLAYFNLQDSLVIRSALEDQVLNYEFRFKRTEEITNIFVPFLKIAPEATIRGFFDERAERFTLAGNADYIKVFGSELLDWNILAETKPDRLDVKTGCSRLYLFEPTSEDTVMVYLDSLVLLSSMHHDSILYIINWKDIRQDNFLNGYMYFPADGSYITRIADMNARIGENVWSIDSGNYIRIDSTSILFNNVGFLSDKSELSIEGSISEHPRDTLRIGFQNFNISELDHILVSENIDIDGILSGNISLTNLYDKFSMYGDLKLNEFYFNKQHLGDATVKIDYLTQMERFDIDAQILYTGNIGTSIPLAVVGSYWLGKKPHFELDASMKNLNLKMVEPFVSDFMPKLSGLVSGQVKMKGTFEEPDLSGTLNLMRTEFTIGYLNVSYSMADKVTVERNRFVFDNITLYDSLGNKAYLNGAISHQAFSDIMLDLNIAMSDFSAFNNTFAQNNLFFGKARATGNVRIYGPVNNIRVSIHAANGGNTMVTIPINLTADVGQLDYVIFEQVMPDTLINLTGAGRVVPVSGFSLDLNLEVKPDAVVNVFLPDQLGKIQAQGFGDLSMTMTPTTPFLIKGNYEITKGSFLLQLKNLIRLPFMILPGSRIAWSGDPSDADLGISASYKTKVPLAGLTSDPELSGTRVNVECIIRVSGKLMNPLLTFGLNIPNAEEAAKTIVYNAIDTTNQAELSQQVLYILVLNQFNPIAGGNSAVNLSGTPLTLVTNQINTLFSGLTSHVNVDVNYRPASSDVSQEFDVGLATQFLDDRLLIEGTFGMSNNRNTTLEQASTIVGDINIQYALNKNKQLWVRAFNRTNTVDVLDNKAPYTQGVGISYQRNFSSLRDLFRSKKKEKTEN